VAYFWLAVWTRETDIFPSGHFPPDISPLTNPLPDLSPSTFRRSRTFPPPLVMSLIFNTLLIMLERMSYIVEKRRGKGPGGDLSGGICPGGNVRRGKCPTLVYITYCPLESTLWVDFKRTKFLSYDRQLATLRQQYYDSVIVTDGRIVSCVLSWFIVAQHLWQHQRICRLY